MTTRKPRRRGCVLALVLVAFMGISRATPALAQGTAAISGLVKDTTGAVLPGATVEASSAALIEKSRTVFTDTAGQYKIVSLPPGTYTVTFTLAGFNVV